MAILNPDLSEAQDMTPIVEGTYKAKIVEAAAQNSKKGTPMVVPKFHIEVESGKKPRTRKTYVPVSGEGASGFDQLLRAVHMDDLADKLKDPNVNPKPSFDTDSLVGQELMVTIVPELYVQRDDAGNPIGQGEMRDRIKGYLKA